MEWVVTTGRTIDDAKEAALDQLGVDEQDAEFEVLDEPKTGLFGRLRGEARVRARVRPTRPRAKVDRRPQRRRSGGRGRKTEDRSEHRPTAGGAVAVEDEDTERDASESVDGAPTQNAPDVPAKRKRRRGGRGRSGGGQGGGRAADAGVASDGEQENGSDMDEATVEQQADITEEFLRGLVNAFDLDATIDHERIDDETIEVRVDGPDLGLLVGPKGNTLQAIQELSRTVIQRQVAGTHHGRVRIDVAGYRQKRKVALEKFASQVAADVAASGVAKALEPMHPADRKIVHDAINEIDGVRTTSEGEEPRRHVVIRPAGGED